MVDLNREDFEQELELQNLKGQITKMIRANQALEKDLDTMDIKIGLLVSNQIDVQARIPNNVYFLTLLWCAFFKKILKSPYRKCWPTTSHC